ncbi:hypothetical protein [Acinetobacter sp.]|uniref:hypothetical protein n=1 Tax=Acinetobacter sp. TaxID=472 RepID=UPI0025C2C2B2|nr:hypothetical protein [Acinetobacter sp.]
MEIRILKNPIRYNLAHFIGDVVELDEKIAEAMVKNGDGELVGTEEKPKKTAKK